MTTLIDGAEVMIDAPMSKKTRRFMQAMVDAAPPPSVRTNSYQGRHRVLMIYGPGSPAKLPLLARHRARGGRIAMWDIGYWDRARHMRLSIDTLHPTPQQLALAPPGVGRRQFDLREDADPAGPIMLIGLGQKSLYAYQLGAAQQWETKRLSELRERYPGREIVWRPKGAYAVTLDQLPMRHGMPIDEALRGCSLVVVRHSNVAVDAAIAGIPVECEAGAAHALYAAGSAPSREQRAEFLRRLSWWEWAPDEAAAAWGWIDTVMEKSPCA